MTSTSMSTQDTQNANVMAPKFTFKLNPQVQLPLNLYIHVIDIWWLKNIFHAFQCTHEWQIEI